MLVLTRKAGEVITIDENIVIQIVQVRGRQVRVGIEAPKSKRIQRGELTMATPALTEVLDKRVPVAESPVAEGL